MTTMTVIETVSDYCTRTGESRHAVYDKLRRGDLDGFKIGNPREWRIVRQVQFGPLRVIDGDKERYST